jgi:hypothetical protein
MRHIITLLGGVAILLLAKRSGVATTLVDPNAIRPFHVNIPQKEIDDLLEQVLATRWPDKETVRDQSQGVQLATIQALARYWATDCGWRKCEAKLNAYPQFDGLL